MNPTVAPLAFLHYGDYYQVFLWRDWTIRRIVHYSGGFEGHATDFHWDLLDPELQHTILWKIEQLKRL